jgi:hypothetical protein
MRQACKSVLIITISLNVTQIAQFDDVQRADLRRHWLPEQRSYV